MSLEARSPRPAAVGARRESDAYVTADMPDNVSAAAIALAVNSSGAAQVSTVVLMTQEELDVATKKTVDYRPPGG
jgi:hypothetical protein